MQYSGHGDRSLLELLLHYILAFTAELQWLLLITEVSLQQVSINEKQNESN